MPTTLCGPTARHTQVEKVLVTLDTEKIVLLHLLNAIDRPVDISFFARHYGHAGELRLGHKY